MDQQIFEDRLAELVAEALDAGVTRDDVITGLECSRQCLIDEQAAEEEEAEHG